MRNRLLVAGLLVIDVLLYCEKFTSAVPVDSNDDWLRCLEGWEMCPSGDKCIRDVWKCDGDNDCGDFSDEQDCQPLECDPDYFKCERVQKCIHAREACDGHPDCDDGSDENLDPCPSFNCLNENAFKCLTSRRCVYTKWYLCDGADDCGDGSDEIYDLCKDCDELTELRCDNGQCINKAAFCTLGWTHRGCSDDSLTQVEQCETISCPEGWEKCRSTDRCYSPDQWCDRFDNCGDWSDEDMDECPPFDCRPDEFKCEEARQCIPAPQMLCDGVNNCRNGSDENPANCGAFVFRCPSDEFKCRSNDFCIPQRAVCDEYVDCRDNSDEENCPEFECEPAEFKCEQIRRCIHPLFLCDKRDDCGDGSDERPEVCALYTTTMEPVFSCHISMYTCMATTKEKYFIDDSVSQFDVARNTDARQLCSDLLQLRDCQTDVLKSGSCQSLSSVFRSFYSAPLEIIEFVCHQHLDVFSENKDCLLRLANNSEFIQLNVTIEHQCPPETIIDGHQRCIPQERWQCVLDVILEQCGSEITSYIRELEEQIMSLFPCSLINKDSMEMLTKTLSSLKF